MPNYIWPVDINTVTQEFGANPNPDYQPDGHSGMDFGIPIGTPVVSPAAGRVVYEGWTSGLGWPNEYYLAIDFDGPANGDQSAGIIVVVDHGDGKPASIFGHLNGTVVNIGDTVQQGQLLGHSGMTGRSTGPHLHFEMLPPVFNVHGRFYGRVNPRDYCSTGAASAPEADRPLAPNERETVASGVIRRLDHSRSAGEIDRFPGGRALVIGGWKFGEPVDGNAVWFEGGISGGWMWSGGFTSQSTQGLTDKNPPAPVLPSSAPDPFKRISGPDGVKRRTVADKAGTLIDTFPADREITISGFVRGTDPFGKGNNIWFVGGLTGGFMWSGGFTNGSTVGLPDFTPPGGVQATPAPPKPIYDFEADFDFVEKAPANITNVEREDDNPLDDIFPDRPEYIVVHQMGTPGVDTLGSTTNEFKRPNSFKSTHFGVAQHQIKQYVKLGDRAYHAGKVGNNYISIETDPVQDAATIESTRILIEAIREHYGYDIPLIRHKDIPGNATSCGDLIDLDKYDVPWTTPVAPAPVVPPQPVQPPAVTLTEAGVLTSFFDWLTHSYINRQK